MTASRTSAVGAPPARRAGGRTSFVSPVIDYEPPPVGATPTLTGQAAPCPPPSPTALRRRTTRPLRLVSHPPVREAAPPRAAILFADTALRRVLEVIDRRRPIAQLRPLLAPALIDTVTALTRSPNTGGTARPQGRGTAATLQRLRLRMVDDEAAEVFGTYTRGPRVRAFAARIARNDDRWRIVALQVG